jgi:hypothetical protein
MFQEFWAAGNMIAGSLLMTGQDMWNTPKIVPYLLPHSNSSIERRGVLLQKARFNTPGLSHIKRTLLRVLFIT